MIPRIRGRLSIIESPEDLKGKWAFEISIWDFTGEKQVGGPMGPFGPFETEEIASREMSRACRMACEVYETSDGGKPSGNYLDMKNGGILRPWDAQ